MPAIEESGPIALSERDSLLVLELLKNPPAPNARLRASIAQMPKQAPHLLPVILEA